MQTRRLLVWCGIPLRRPFTHRSPQPPRPRGVRGYLSSMMILRDAIPGIALAGVSGALLQILPPWVAFVVVASFCAWVGAAAGTAIMDWAFHRG